jgi:aminoglycoside phosphotransferase
MNAATQGNEIMQLPAQLTQKQVQEIMRLAGLHEPATATLMQQYNHVYRIECQQGIFFLKMHTKDWYPPEDVETGFSVRHEQSAWSVLASHGLATPEVVLAVTTRNNSLGRPFLLTRKLQGKSLVELLKHYLADESQWDELLRTTGAYLQQMHRISFRFPGYILDTQPDRPLDESRWQHPIWSARQRQRTALAQLQREQSQLSQQTTQQLYRLFSTLEEVLATEYQPPRFTHGDCHAHQFYLYHNEVGTWMVSGCVDMEVASAGDSLQDLVKIAIEMVREFPGRDWWTPLFAGYGKEPDFDTFRLRLLCAAEEELQWSGIRQEVLNHLLQAGNWAELFTFERSDSVSSH